MTEKAQLRRACRAQRRRLPPQERGARSAAAQVALLAHPGVARAKRWLLYLAYDAEVLTDALAAAARIRGCPVLYPRWTPGQALAWVVPEGWRTGSAGLPIPEGEATGLAAGDLVVVPGLAFDDEGYRLGQGGGAYDRTLTTRDDVLAIGLGYAFQRVRRVPREAWDVPLHAVATDAGLDLLQGEETRH